MHKTSIVVKIHVQHGTYRVSTRHIAEIDNSIDLWSPGLKLPLPGRHGRERDDKEERTKQLMLVVEPVEEGDSLDSLT